MFGEDPLDTKEHYKTGRDHYRALFERHMVDSTRYQALLFHAWKALREHQKGMQHQARKIKRLRKELALAKETK